MKKTPKQQLEDKEGQILYAEGVTSKDRLHKVLLNIVIIIVALGLMFVLFKIVSDLFSV